MVTFKSSVARIRPLVRRTGFDVTRWPGQRHGFLRSRVLDRLDIGRVIDVGANVGQFGQQLRQFGYRGRIVSYEPMRDAFEQLAMTAQRDGQWDAIRAACGAEHGQLELNIAGNSISSSLLPMLDRHAGYAPHSRYVDRESVDVERLDVLEQEADAAVPTFLKVDTQGYEAAVLDGAAGMIDRLHAIELEMSLVPLYEGQVLMPETTDRLVNLGFRLSTISPGLVDASTGETLQVDGIFVRS